MLYREITIVCSAIYSIICGTHIFIIYVSARCFRILPSVVQTESSQSDTAATLVFCMSGGLAAPCEGCRGSIHATSSKHCLWSTCYASVSFYRVYKPLIGKPDGVKQILRVVNICMDQRWLRG